MSVIKLPWVYGDVADLRIGRGDAVYRGIGIGAFCGDLIAARHFAGDRLHIGDAAEDGVGIPLGQGLGGAAAA